MELLDFVKKYKLPDGFLDLSISLRHEEWEPHNWYTHTKKVYEENDPLVNYVTDEDIEKYFFPVYYNFFREYEKDCSIPYELVIQINGVRFNQYSTGTSMRSHSDLVYSVFSDSPVHKRGIPILSIVGEVSTESYSGGEFYLLGQDMQMEPGDVIIFPSTFMYPHEVKPVLSGTRTSFVSWAW